VFDRVIWTAASSNLIRSLSVPVFFAKAHPL
jgi:hypothetical protein